MEEPILDVTTTVGIGVLSGVITAALIWVVRKFLKDTLIPLYQTKIYRGVNITGVWEGEQIREGRGEFRFKLRLEQKGHNLTGVFISNDIYPDGETDSHEYIVEGKVEDGWVLITYHSGSSRSIGLGSLLLQIRDAGNQLLGGIMFLKTKKATVGTDDILKLSRTVE